MSSSSRSQLTLTEPFTLALAILNDQNVATMIRELEQDIKLKITDVFQVLSLIAYTIQYQDEEKAIVDDDIKCIANLLQNNCETSIKILTEKYNIDKQTLLALTYGEKGSRVIDRYKTFLNDASFDMTNIIELLANHHDLKNLSHPIIKFAIYTLAQYHLEIYYYAPKEIINSYTRSFNQTLKDLCNIKLKPQILAEIKQTEQTKLDNVSIEQDSWMTAIIEKIKQDYQNLQMKHEAANKMRADTSDMFASIQNTLPISATLQSDIKNKIKAINLKIRTLNQNELFNIFTPVNDIQKALRKIQENKYLQLDYDEITQYFNQLLEQRTQFNNYFQSGDTKLLDELNANVTRLSAYKMKVKDILSNQVLTKAVSRAEQYFSVFSTDIDAAIDKIAFIKTTDDLRKLEADESKALEMKFARVPLIVEKSAKDQLNFNLQKLNESISAQILRTRYLNQNLPLASAIEATTPETLIKQFSTSLSQQTLEHYKQEVELLSERLDALLINKIESTPAPVTEPEAEPQIIPELPEAPRKFYSLYEDLLEFKEQSNDKKNSDETNNNIKVTIIESNKPQNTSAAGHLSTIIEEPEEHTLTSVDNPNTRSAKLIYDHESIRERALLLLMYYKENLNLRRNCRDPFGEINKIIGNLTHIDIEEDKALAQLAFCDAQLKKISKDPQLLNNDAKVSFSELKEIYQAIHEICAELKSALADDKPKDPNDIEVELIDYVPDYTNLVKLQKLLGNYHTLLQFKQNDLLDNVKSLLHSVNEVYYYICQVATFDFNQGAPTNQPAPLETVVANTETLLRAVNEFLHVVEEDKKAEELFEKFKSDLPSSYLVKLKRDAVNIIHRFSILYKTTIDSTAAEHKEELSQILGEHIAHIQKTTDAQLVIERFMKFSEENQSYFKTSIDNNGHCKMIYDSKESEKRMLLLALAADQLNSIPGYIVGKHCKDHPEIKRISKIKYYMNYLWTVKLDTDEQKREFSEKAGHIEAALLAYHSSRNRYSMFGYLSSSLYSAASTAGNMAVSVASTVTSTVTSTVVPYVPTTVATFLGIRK